MRWRDTLQNNILTNVRVEAAILPTKKVRPRAQENLCFGLAAAIAIFSIGLSFEADLLMVLPMAPLLLFYSYQGWSERKQRLAEQREAEAFLNRINYDG